MPKKEIKCNFGYDYKSENNKINNINNINNDGSNNNDIQKKDKLNEENISITDKLMRIQELINQYKK